MTDIVPNITYLASPYSHPNVVVRIQRYFLAVRCCAHLMAGNYAGRPLMVFSPIVHDHPIGNLMKHTSWADWRDRDLMMLRVSQRLLVFQIPGWEKSEGVKAEIEAARGWGLPVDFLPREVIP